MYGQRAEERERKEACSSVSYAPVLRIFPVILKDHEKLSIFMQIFSKVRESRSNKHKTDQACFRDAVLRIYPLLHSDDISDSFVSKDKGKQKGGSGSPKEKAAKQSRVQRRRAEEDGVALARHPDEEKNIIDGEAKIAAGSVEQLLSHVQEGCTFKPFSINELVESGVSQWQQDDNTTALVKQDQARELRKNKEVEKRRERKERKNKKRKALARNSHNSFY